MAEVETIFAPPAFEIVNFSAVVSDVIPPGVQPSRLVLDSDQDFFVTVRWQTVGGGVGMVGGRWHLLVVAESIGPGDEVILFDPADHIFDITPGLPPGPINYSRTVDVPANTLPVVGGHGVTLYKLVTSLTVFDLAGNRGPIAGYVEGPIIQIYESTL